MDSLNCIEQRGVIENISQGNASVIFSATSVCGSCAAQGVCELFGTNSKRIIVPVKPDEFVIGEVVGIRMKRKSGWIATIIAYAVPFILLISSLVIGTFHKMSELVTGLVCIGVLMLYFIGLYFFRNHFKKAFTFIIQKIS